MSGWGTFWYYVVGLAIISYFGLAIVLTIGGFFDVRKMFRRLNAQHGEVASMPSATEVEDRGSSPG